MWQLSRYKLIALLVAVLFAAVVMQACGEAKPLTSSIDSDGDGWNDTQEQTAGTDLYNDGGG